MSKKKIIKQFKTVYKPLEDLIPYAKNSKTHSAEQIARIMGNIVSSGFTSVILIDEHNGLIAGHGRLIALQRLIEQGFELQEGEIDCKVIPNLTEAQKAALVIADNKLAEVGADWDNGLLQAELMRIKELDPDLLADIGMPPEEIESLLNGWDSDIELGDPKETEPAVVVKTGDEDVEAVLAAVQDAIDAAGFEVTVSKR